MNTSKMRNPVFPSPWTSRAPHGFGHPPKKLSRLSCFTEDSSNATIQNTRPRVQRHRTILKDSELFRNLNRNTLILSFPEVHPNQIDAALTLCDNDLSETISLLQLRIRILKNRKMHVEQRNAGNTITSSTSVKNQPLKTVKYIPTKYSDVHIVEEANKNINNNQMKVMEVNKNVLQMLETCETTMLLPPNTNSVNNIQPPKHTITTSAIMNGCSSETEFSPTSTIGSSVRSDDSEKLKVLSIIKCPEKQERIVILPKKNLPRKILPRTLTFCIPFSPDNN